MFVKFSILNGRFIIPMSYADEGIENVVKLSFYH